MLQMAQQSPFFVLEKYYNLESSSYVLVETLLIAVFNHCLCHIQYIVLVPPSLGNLAISRGFSRVVRGIGCGKTVRPDINRSRPVRATNYQKLSRLKKLKMLPFCLKKSNIFLIPRRREKTSMLFFSKRIHKKKAQQAKNLHFTKKFKKTVTNIADVICIVD